MWLLLQNKPDDYIIATGETHSIKEAVEFCFSYVGLEWSKHVDIDEQYFRPAEVNVLCGNASKAKRELNWHPTHNWKDTLRMMLDRDLQNEKI